jgi:hypothetical protein
MTEGENNQEGSTTRRTAGEQATRGRGKEPQNKAGKKGTRLLRGREGTAEGAEGPQNTTQGK